MESAVRPIGEPLHTAHYLRCKGEYTTAEEMRERMLYLPCRSDQSMANVEKVIQILKSNDLA